MAVSTNLDSVVTVSYDKKIKIWDCNLRFKNLIKSAHESTITLSLLSIEPITCVKFADEGHKDYGRFATVGYDGFLKIWELSGELHYKIVIYKTCIF